MAVVVLAWGLRRRWPRMPGLLSAVAVVALAVALAGVWGVGLGSVFVPAVPPSVFAWPLLPDWTGIPWMALARQQGSALVVLAVLMALAALSVMVYTGAEIMVVRARPLWNTVFLPINLALTGWMAALGAMLVVARWLPGGLAALPAPLLRTLSLAAALLLMAAVALWVGTGMVGEAPSYLAARRLFTDFSVWRLSMLGSVLGGVAVLLWLQRPAQTLVKPVASMLLGLTMLAAAWVFRWALFMGVQGVPKFGAGLYVYSMPLGGDGLLGMVGVVGLLVALLAAITLALEYFPARSTPLQRGAIAA